MTDLFSEIQTVMNTYEYPMPRKFTDGSIEWLNNTLNNICGDQHEIKSPEFSLNKKVPIDAPFEYKSYYLDPYASVTCLEEAEKMSNDDGTTGLITWQGAIGLYNFFQSQVNIFPKSPKILELGSGAGLLGLGLLKATENISSYLFTDVHHEVLNSIATNYHLNFDTKKILQEKLLDYMQSGPFKIFQQDVSSATQLSDSPKVIVQHLDWLNCSDDLIDSLDFNIG